MSSKINFPTILHTSRDIARYQLFSVFGGSPYPRRVQIALTYKCNSRCIMCNIWKLNPTNEMSLREWKQKVRDPIFNFIEQVDITGGEALLHSEFTEICTLFVNSFPRLQKMLVITNGLMPTNVENKIKDVARLCTDRGIRFAVSVSLDGVGTLHDRIRGIPHASAKVRKTFFQLKKLQKQYPFELESGSLLVHQNIRQANLTTQWFRKNNINFQYQLVGFHETYVRNTEREKSVNYSPDDADYLEDILKKEGTPKSLTDFRSYYWKDMLAMYKEGKKRTTPCPFLFDQFAIDSFGDVYYCFSEKKIGNCRNGKSISSIYFNKNNLKRRKFMQKSKCLSCNSGCAVERGVALDLKKYIWFRLTGRLWFNKGV